LVATVLWALCSGPAAAQDSSIWLGVWSLNLHQSSYDPGPAPYSRATMTVTPDGGGGVRMVYDMVRVRGGVTHLEWSGGFDGKDYPVQGLDEVLTNAYRRIDERTYDVTVKVDGRVTATARVTFSEDGRTMTTATVGANPQAQQLRWRTVYEKQ
jgi:hypothetical protein